MKIIKGDLRENDVLEEALKFKEHEQKEIEEESDEEKEITAEEEEIETEEDEADSSHYSIGGDNGW